VLLLSVKLVDASRNQKVKAVPVNRGPDMMLSYTTWRQCAACAKAYLVRNVRHMNNNVMISETFDVLIAGLLN
jgi:hypothetical protein